MPDPMTLRELNALDRESFVRALGSLFEGPPWIVAEAWPARPFTSVAHLHQTLCAVMRRAPIEQQIALLQAHPDLMGRAALAGALTPESASEQAAAGLDRFAPADVATFSRLNRAYHERFGFPFVICAREHTKESILASFTARLQNSRDQEITTALEEVARICALRLPNVVRADDDQG